jgi:hypothetical protein
MWHVQVRVKVHSGLWWGNVKEGNNFDDLGVDGMKIVKWVFFKK